VPRHLDAAARALGESGLFASAMIEVNPACAAAGRFLIGRAREAGDERKFRWFITIQSGGFDHAGGVVASTPWEAARHFSMKWQLDAAKVEDPAIAAVLPADLSVPTFMRSVVPCASLVLKGRRGTHILICSFPRQSPNMFV
jgi:hypothetical protein